MADSEPLEWQRLCDEGAEWTTIGVSVPIVVFTDDSAADKPARARSSAAAALGLRGVDVGSVRVEAEAN